MDEIIKKEKPIKLLITIVDRGKGEKVTALYKKLKVSYQLILLGQGTADSDIIDLLGLAETDKDVVLSVVEVDLVGKIFERLNEDLQFNKAGHGIAFTIPISSVGGPITLSILKGLFERGKQ